jgi:hypothetical protein
MAGPAYPPLKGLAHNSLGPSLGNLVKIPPSFQTPSLFGPSHWGQSAEKQGFDPDIKAITRKISNRNGFLVQKSLEILVL